MDAITVTAQLGKILFDAVKEIRQALMKAKQDNRTVDTGALVHLALCSRLLACSCTELLLLLDSGNSAALDAGFHKLLKRWEAFVKALEKGNPAALVLFNPHLETEIERTILAEFECLDEEGVGPLLDAIRQAGGRAGRLRKNLANTDELTAAFADRCGSMANVLRRSGYRLSEVNAASEYVEPEMAPGQPLTPLASAVASLGEHALLCYSEIRGLLVGNWSIKDLSAPAGE